MPIVRMPVVRMPIVRMPIVLAPSNSMSYRKPPGNTTIEL